MTRKVCGPTAQSVLLTLHQATNKRSTCRGDPRSRPIRWGLQQWGNGTRDCSTWAVTCPVHCSILRADHKHSCDRPALHAPYKEVSSKKPARSIDTALGVNLMNLLERVLTLLRA